MLVLLTALMLAQSPLTQVPAAQAAKGMSAVASIDDLMVYVLYPMADALFYINPDPPPTDEQWKDLQGKAMLLAEAGNLLMMPGRLDRCCTIPTSIKPATNTDKWMANAKMLVDAGTKAFEATKKKDVDAVLELNEELYNACVQCHADFRPGYGRKPIGPGR